jgi:hypothetical protein
MKYALINMHKTNTMSATAGSSKWGGARYIAPRRTAVSDFTLFCNFARYVFVYYPDSAVSQSCNPVPDMSEIVMDE